VSIGQSLASPTPQNRAEFVLAVQCNSMIDSKNSAIEVNNDVSSFPISVIHNSI
jgi:hypothetical protein